MLDKRIGKSELELLQFIAKRGRVTLREASASFAVERGYARTTLQQMMERLRKKGFLDREQQDGVFRYFSVEPADSLQTSLVQHFVEGTLGGSVSPFVAYLNSRGAVSAQELDELRQLVEKLEQEEKS
ncbi:MAG: BlaI/MecI/CopY family transcriptional regulator [Armatimonadetes bacterium]|nr:BlaI/MecI/CopY family transcriptional regulator [Armatimonadota bacterium]